MTTIDHPLLAAERALKSGFLDPASLATLRAEVASRPRTPAWVRESIFEILGEGFRGCLPVAIEAVLDPETVAMGFEEADGDIWMAIGPVDDASVLELSDGSWFGAAPPAPDADRRMVGFVLDPESAGGLDAALSDDRHPIWAIPATRCIPLGSEREFRALMGEADANA